MGSDSQKDKNMPRSKMMLPVLVMAAIMVLSACGGQANEPAAIVAAPAGTVKVSFAKDVLPILQSRCVKCHGSEKTEKALDMTSYEQLMAGSENGTVVVAGDPANSKFIQLIQQGKMPKRGPKMLPDQFQTLVNWVAAGAVKN